MLRGTLIRQNIDLTYYQYRCRSDNHYGYPRIIEAHVMSSIHKLFNEKKLGKIKSLQILFLLNSLNCFMFINLVGNYLHSLEGY